MKFFVRYKKIIKNGASELTVKSWTVIELSDSEYKIFNKAILLEKIQKSIDDEVAVNGLNGQHYLDNVIDIKAI